MKFYNIYRPKKYRNKKQIVILVSAGFVSPWTDSNSSTIKNLIVNDSTYTIKGQTLGKFIFEKLDSFYNCNGVNFETFIAVIEDVMNYVISSTNENKSVKNTSISPITFVIKDVFKELLKDKTENEKRVYIFNIYNHYINVILNEIKAYNDHVLDSKNSIINNKLINLIDYL